MEQKQTKTAKGKRSSLQAFSTSSRRTNDLFFAAIQEGELELVKKYLGEGRKANECEREFGKSALHIAATQPLTAMLSLLIDHGADVNFEGKRLDFEIKDRDASGAMKRLPIHDAAIADQGNNIIELVARGSKVDTKDGSSSTPLHLAAEADCLNAVIALCEKCRTKADINAIKEKDQCRTALHIAIINENVEVALALIRYGAKIDIKDGENHLPAYYAAQHGLDSVIAALSAHPANQTAKTLQSKAAVLGLDVLDKHKNSLLHIAAREGNIPSIETLCTQGVDKEGRNDKDLTPLLMAAKAGQEGAMLCLKKQGAENNVLYEGNNTLLHLLARRGHVACLATAIQWINEAAPLTDIDYKNEDLNTPLHFAAEKCHLEMMALLCELKRFNVNANNRHEETPLAIMLSSFQLDYDESKPSKIDAYNERVKIAIELLLQHGAIVTAADVRAAESNSHLLESIKQQLRDALAKAPALPDPASIATQQRLADEARAKQLQEHEAEVQRQLEESRARQLQEAAAQQQRLREAELEKQQEDDAIARAQAQLMAFLSEIPAENHDMPTTSAEPTDTKLSTSRSSPPAIHSGLGTNAPKVIVIVKPNPATIPTSFLNRNRINGKGPSEPSNAASETELASEQCKASSSPQAFFGTSAEKIIDLHGTHVNTHDKTYRVLTDDSVTIVKEYLQQKPKATAVLLMKNDIGPNGANRLCTILAKHELLEELNISDNPQLTTEVTKSKEIVDAPLVRWLGAKALANLLKTNKCLKNLLLGNTGLNDHSLSVLSDGLAECKTLEIFDISNNAITDMGIASICDNLQQIPTLSQVIITNNKLTDVCGNRLLRLLQEKPQIIILDIRNNEFSDEMLGRINEELKINQAGRPPAPSSPTLN